MRPSSQQPGPLACLPACPADIDELANPLQAAVVSAICFTCGAALPLLSAAWIMDPNLRLGILAGATTSEWRLQQGGGVG